MRVASALVLFAITLLLAAPAGAEDRVTEEFPDGSGFSYALPSGWKPVERPNQKFKVVTNEASAVNGLAPNMIVKDGVFSGTLEAFAEQTKTGFKKAYPNFTELGTDQLKTTGGVDFIRIIASNELNSRKVRQSFFMYEGPNNLKLAITCTLPVEVAERFDGSLETTAKSFRFEKGTVVSTVLSSHFDDVMKRMVAHIKETKELGKDATDEDIKVKAVDPVYEGLLADHMLEVPKPLERNFAAGKFMDESNQKILNDLCSFIEGFNAEKTPAAKFILAENKAGTIKGADLEVAIRIMKWSLMKLKDSLQSKQQTKDLTHPEPPIGPKAPPQTPPAPEQPK